MTVEFARDLLVALMVVSVMLSVGFELELRQLRSVFRRPRLLASGLGFEHVLMPLVAFGIARAFGAPPEGVLAVVLCAATPGGPIGPAFVVQAHGDVPFAVALVVLMAAINVFTTPLTLTLFGFGGAVEGGIALPLIKTIALYQLLPLGLSMAWRERHPESARKLARVCEMATKVIIALVIVGMTVARWRLLLSIDHATLAAILCSCLAAVVGGYALAAGGPPQRRALGLTAGVRNLGLGLLVAASAFGDETLLAVMVYGLVMLIVVAPISMVWARRNPAPA